MPTDYGTKIYNRYAKALARLKDRVSSCRSFKSTSSELFAAICEVRDGVKLPPYYRGLLEGWGEALRASVWRNDVKWVQYLDGEAMTSHKVSVIADIEERAGKSRAATWARVRGRFEWSNGKAFTEFEAAEPLKETHA